MKQSDLEKSLDPNPEPAIFVIDFQDAIKKNIFFFYVFLLIRYFSNDHTDPDPLH
jgi:hypothetical protein